MAGLYIHIPFCKKACHYCDFHFSVSQKLKGEVLRALRKEIELKRDYAQGEVLKTIYFGGGSPSILSPDEIKSLLESIFLCHQVDANAEITLEANPDDLDEHKTSALLSLGINRLSIGIQSFRNEDLKLMNRAHNAEMAFRSIEIATNAGFQNLNLDLIYGIPGLNLEDWEKNVSEFLKTGAHHLSAYSLTYEDRTAFGTWIKNGKLTPLEDEDVLQQFKALMRMMSEGGYEQYEISNFAHPSFESKHNSSYWKGEKYIGIGPSAHSFDGTRRTWNIRSNPLYIKALESGASFSEEEILSEKDEFNEYLLTSLRTKWGIDLTKVEMNWGESRLETMLGEAEPYFENGSLLLLKNIVYLSEKGKFVADKITSDLFAL